MELVLILRELAGRRRILAIGVGVAALIALVSVYRIDGFGLKSRALVHSSASTQVLVDSDSSVIGNVSQSFEPLAARASVYANFMTSPSVLGVIAHRVGLSGEQLYAAGPVSVAEPRVEQEPTAIKRNVEITGETKPYRLSFESQTGLPTITINAQAPTTAKAVALADAAAAGMSEYVSASETANGVPDSARVIVRQLGPARGAVDDPAIRKSLAALVFLAVLILWCVGMLLVPRIRDAWRASASLSLEDGDEHPLAPAPRAPAEAGRQQQSAAANGHEPLVVDEGTANGERRHAPATSPLDIETEGPGSPLFEIPPYPGEHEPPELPEDDRSAVAGAERSVSVTHHTR